MESTLIKGQIASLLQELSIQPELKVDSNIISLTGNELASISLKISSYIRKELSIDQLLENTVNILGEAGIAEKILLFQIDNEGTKALLTHHWESPYIPKFNPVGFQLDLRDAPLFKLFHLNTSHTFQIGDFMKYLALPNYLFRNKFKALFIKLKTRSMLVTTGSSHKVRVALNLQFSTRDVIWSNEIEKVLQSVIDQLAVAIDQALDKRKKETLQKNIIQLQESAIREQEELLRQFASDVHDLPCSIIPNLKRAIRDKDFNECERLVDELHNNLRQLINEYVIPDINLLGFGSTIYQFVNGFKKSFKGKISVELPNEEINLPNKKGIELFKVMKEWFCNIEKHSCASEVLFSLKKLNENYLLITISDNGKGFDVNDTKNLGYGILNIKRRLSEIKSKFEIKSEVNKGTTLKMQLSLTS
ncbi:MAG: hypothetical protein HY094_04120 [Candidatus Melainabacteria bacterium]|nr:hypothetical protein [Candidatus Melainabacteria bacterium]